MSTNSFVMPNDMSDLCRVCLQLPEESQYLDLTTIYDEEDNLTYGECFTICTQIDLNAGEGLPHHLCKSCGLELQMSYDFHKKIGESGQVIEQFQRQIKVQKANVTELTPITEESKNSNLVGEKKNPLAQLINEKYVIIEEQEQLPQPSKKAIESCMIQRETEQGLVATLNVIDETDEIDVLNNICPMEDNIHLPSHKSITSIETVSENDIRIDGEDHLEVEDYQNLETLEDEGKMNKLLTNIKTKQEVLNRDQYIQALLNQNGVEIKKEISNECQDRIMENKNENTYQDIGLTKTNDEIKIENETVSEYIVTNATVLESLNHFIPTHSLCHLSDLNTQLQNERIETAFECEFCGHSLPTKNSLYKHRLRKHKNKKDFYRNPMPTPIKCSLCCRIFKTMASLRTHMDVKHSNKNFVCEHCGHNLPTKNALCQHRLRKHRNIEKCQKKLLIFECSLCSETFITAKGLNLHKKSTHIQNSVIIDDKTWFPCEECGHKLPTKNALSQHRLRKHRNKKVTKNSYRCIYCKIYLPSNERLQSHLVESHEVLPALKQLVDRI